MNRFEFRDPDGDRLAIEPFEREDGAHVIELHLVEHDARLHIPLDRLEEVIAGLRDMARQTGGQTEPVRPPASTFTATERQFLRFALGLAADLMANRGDEFDDEDEAALDRFRRMTTEEAGA